MCAQVLTVQVAMGWDLVFSSCYMLLLPDSESSCSLYIFHTLDSDSLALWTHYKAGLKKYI